MRMFRARYAGRRKKWWRPRYDPDEPVTHSKRARQQCFRLAKALRMHGQNL